MNRYGVLTKDAQGNYRVTITNNQEAAEALRDRLDAAGAESYGIIRVVSEADAKVKA